MSHSTYHYTFLALCQSIAFNKIYVLHGQKNILVNIQNKPRKKRNMNAIMAQACLTMRLTNRTNTKVDHSDLGVSCGKAFAQWIKGTMGIIS